jgi:glycosyltransferase involved in cell wall biosynthesis
MPPGEGLSLRTPYSVLRTPRISLVTPSYNQGRFLGRTIESVLAQDYPRVEHIVVDGMSSDETPRVLARYPHLRVIREPDGGQADAVNKGFRAAGGDVFGFLNSDDTLAPGALRRVAREIDAARGRHVVVGRCRFIDADDRPTGLEHPSAFEGHRRVLEVWKGHCLPQPAVFWTREVWQRCGPLDAREQLVLDYDLFCRFSRRYPFHAVDQVLANYRLHARSKTCSADGRRVLEESIRVSRKYWKGLPPAEYVRLLWSYGRYRLGRRKWGMGLLKQAREEWQKGNRLGLAWRAAACAALAPDVLALVVVLPEVAERRPGWFGRLGWLDRLCRGAGHAQTTTWREFTGLHADGWAGPEWETEVDVGPEDTELRLEGSIEVGHHAEPLEVAFWVDGACLGRRRVGRRGEFGVAVPLGGVTPGRHALRVACSSFLVLHDFRGNEDFRPVSFRVRRLGGAGGTLSTCREKTAR